MLTKLISRSRAGPLGALRIAVMALLVAAPLGAAGLAYGQSGSAGGGKSADGGGQSSSGADQTSSGSGQSSSGGGQSSSGDGQSTSGGGSTTGSGQQSVQQGGTQLTQSEVDDLVTFYQDRTMLGFAQMLTAGLVGSYNQWNGPYMEPEPDLMTDAAAEFLSIYPRAYLPAPDQSILGTLGDPGLWQALEEIGITLMHPVAFEQAGSIVKRAVQSSVDGGFDRIAFVPEPKMGTEDDVKALVDQGMQHGALVAGDIIPLHVGAGYDFRLAEMGYQDYPGLFDMIEIPEDSWDMLPDVSEQWGFEILLKDDAKPLIDAGLIPGMYDVLLGRESSTDWSGWAATAPILGVDGITRRWVYAFLFKPEQPALNWMDPTYNARILQSGDIVRHVWEYGTIINRLDAVPFLGLEPQADSDQIQIYTTPLAINGTEDLAFLHRKLGGWTWVELNVPTFDYTLYMEYGPDLGYDFFTRAETVHPLITGDARILRVAHRAVIDAGVEHSRLIHALQNHDEIAYQLINLRSQEQVQYGDETLSGTELADRILKQMQDAVTGDAAPYNALYRPKQNGVATTFAGFIGPALGIDPYQATPDEVETIKQAHVMLAVVNAMQPGVFALSEWDLIGALPLDRSLVQDRIAEGDMRWLNRGAVDLMGVADTSVSPFGLPRAQHLYPPLPQQLTDPSSFASQVANIIQARKRWQISDATAVAAPDLEPDSVFALLMRLPTDVGGVAVLAANYSRDQAQVSVDLSPLAEGSDEISGTPHEIISDSDMGSLSGTELSFPLDGLTAVSIVIGGTPGGGSGGGGSTGGGSTGGGSTGGGSTGGDGSDGGGSTGGGSAGGGSSAPGS